MHLCPELSSEYWTDENSDISDSDARYDCDISSNMDVDATPNTADEGGESDDKSTGGTHMCHTTTIPAVIKMGNLWKILRA